MDFAFRDHGGWAFLHLGQSQQYFLQRMQQQHFLNLPQQNFKINQQPQHNFTISQPQPQQAIEYQRQTSSNSGKHESFLERFNTENEHNEKMKNRYADELALKARAELEAEEKKAIEIEKENARKLEEAEQRLKKNRLEIERKEDTLMRTDEAVSRADELKRQVREMTEKAEQEKRDSERRIEERRREAAAKRDQYRQRSLEDSGSRTDEWGTSSFSHESSQTYRGFTDRTIERGYEERGLREGKDTKESNRGLDGDSVREESHREQMLLEDVKPPGSSPALPKHITSDSDDDDSDSDEEKRQDPYKLIGLPDREQTPVKDIKITQRVLNRIHQNSVGGTVSEATRKHAEKRLVEIRWAADILLDEINKRAYDDDGAIYPHEQQSWKKKNGFGGKCIPG
ncbi:hypothetical protein G6011_03397 [Alternaria panax]|uniref:J domain-containing protein n=1 Tax=Alternaria panax TaxID=48097 RepID=A0AAD4IEL8_9PLEO|nr:hypothetical protein G6011_03397 [Alternaria panax]